MKKNGDKKLKTIKKPGKATKVLSIISISLAALFACTVCFTFLSGAWAFGACASGVLLFSAVTSVVSLVKLKKLTSKKNASAKQDVSLKDDKEETKTEEKAKNYTEEEVKEEEKNDSLAERESVVSAKIERPVEKEESAKEEPVKEEESAKEEPVKEEKIKTVDDKKTRSMYRSSYQFINAEVPEEAKTDTENKYSLGDSKVYMVHPINGNAANAAALCDEKEEEKTY